MNRSSPPTSLPSSRSSSSPSPTTFTTDPATLDKLSRLNLEIGEIACYVSYDNTAMSKLAYFVIAFCAGLRLEEERVFSCLDASRLEALTTRLARTRLVVLLLTKKAFHSPHVVAEITKAIELGVPIVPISIERGSFEAARTYLTSPDFPTKLEKGNPGATKILKGIGIDLKRAHATLSEKIPTLLVKELDLDSDLPTWYADWREIYKEIARMIKLESLVGGEIRERALREGRFATFSDFNVRQILDNVRFVMSLPRAEEGDALIDLRRDVYYGRAPIERVIALAESAKTDQLSAYLELIGPSAAHRRGLPLPGPTFNRTVNVFKDSLMLAVSQKNVGIALVGCEGVATALLDNLSHDERGILIRSGLVSAVIAAMNTFAENDPVMAKFGCRALLALVRTDSNRGNSGMSHRHLMMIAELGALDAIVRSMRTFGGVNAGVAEAGCNVISVLSSAGSDLAETLMKLGAGEAIVAAMTAFAGEYLAVNTAGVTTITNLAVHSIDIRYELMKLGAGGAVVEALKRSGPQHAHTAAAGCASIAVLCSTNVEVNTELMNLGAGKAVVEAMRAWGTTDAEVAENGCLALEKLAFYGNSNELVKIGAGEVIVATMRAFGDQVMKVAREGCSVISHFINDSEQFKLTSMNAKKAVVAAMRAFGTKEMAVAELGCLAIAHLVFAASDAVHLINEGAGEVVMAAMRAFGDKEAPVAATGCYAISQLSRIVSMYRYGRPNFDIHRSALIEWGANEVVMKAMRVFGETDKKVAETGCLAINNLAHDSLVNQVALMKMGAGEAVMAAIKAFGADDEAVIMKGCGAISTLCENNLDNALKLTRMGAGEVIVTTMRASKMTTMAAAEMEIFAVDNLISSCDDDDVRTFLRLGTAELVVSIMKEFGDCEATLARRCCSSIAKLAIIPDGVEVLMKLGAADVITAMMSKGGVTDWGVAASACLAISRLAVNVDTATNLIEGGGAVVKAMRVFGQSAEHVAVNGCLAIARLSQAGETEVLMNLGADELVVRALRSFGEWSSEVGDGACEAIVSLIMTSIESRRFWEIGAGKCVMDAMRTFGEIDAGVAENGCEVLVRFAVEEELRREMKSWDGVEELLERIRVGHVGNGGVVSGVEEVMRLLG